MKIFFARTGISKPQTWGDAARLSIFMWHQAGIYLLMNVAEDPAWLAWAFC